METADRPKVDKNRIERHSWGSTNIIAKMGKNEPISMESLAKITTALQCGVDDIVEISTKD